MLTQNGYGYRLACQTPTRECRHVWHEEQTMSSAANAAMHPLSTSVPLTPGPSTLLSAGPTCIIVSPLALTALILVPEAVSDIPADCNLCKRRPKAAA
ncbi:hypothetical protein C8Q80DRAFT_437392 [Daedaleopsis nitida]|nr:hypothetical protein C8Q80DRAFT_437392 [Daedaleopsis nitida]